MHSEQDSSRRHVRQPFQADSSPPTQADRPPGSHASQARKPDVPASPASQAGKPDVLATSQARKPDAPASQVDTPPASASSQAGKPDVPPPTQADTPPGSPPGQARKPDVPPTNQAGKPDVRRAYYERHLPHEIPPGFPIFLTWNLKGSLPQPVLDALERERQQLEKEPLRTGETKRDRSVRQGKILFAKRDHFLDTACDGPMWLKDPQAAQAVVESILWGVPSRYELFAWVVMGNHVHVLLKPSIDLEVITQGIKGYTAYEVNRLQDQRGRTFWQDESFDHWPRDDDELYRIIAYIENNPVKAGLCQRAEDWPWSSAAWRERLGWKQGEPLRPEWKQTILAASTSGFPA